jgi:CYTH domain-containing protein
MIYDKVAQNVIGISLEKAKTKIEKAGATWRITEFNGRSLIVTADLNLKRINIDVNDGVVIRARVG